MLVFLLPFAVVFGVIAMNERAARNARNARALPAPTPTIAPALPPMQSSIPVASVSGGPPSPFEVMVRIMESGRMPPPFVVQCAIAEVRMRGRHDVARDLEHAFANVLAGLPTPPAAQSANPATAKDAASAKAPATPVQATPGAATAPGAGSTPHVELTIASPINGITNEQWSKFATACARESPDFAGPKHVGRYRHNRERLAAIGIDPVSIIGSTDAQDDALGSDAWENLRALVESGTLEQYVSTPITLPQVDPSTPAQTVDLSVSGILGVALAAGLEGCVAWLENEDDRKRFPNTTAAFLRCNGAF